MIVFFQFDHDALGMLTAIDVLRQVLEDGPFLYLFTVRQNAQKFIYFREFLADAHGIDFCFGLNGWAVTSKCFA